MVPSQPPTTFSLAEATSSAGEKKKTQSLLLPSSSSPKPSQLSTFSFRVISFWHDRCKSERTACLRSQQRDPTFWQHHKSATCLLRHTSSSSDLSHQRAILHFLYTTILVSALFTFLCHSLPYVGGNFGKYAPLPRSSLFDVLNAVVSDMVAANKALHSPCPLYAFPMRSYLMTLTTADSLDVVNCHSASHSLPACCC